MKKISGLLLFLLAALPCFLFSQRVGRKGVLPVNTTNSKKTQTFDFSLVQLQGRWQEYKRSTKEKKDVPISDTIYLHFTNTNQVETRDGTKNIMRGEALIDEPGNILLAAADIYTIKSVTKNELILLDDDGTVHSFIKKEIFWRETLGKNTVTDSVFENPISPDLAVLDGSNWTVYRRRSEPSATNNELVLIRYIKSVKYTGNNTATAELTFYLKDKTEVKTCTISVANNQIEIKSDNHSWLLFIYKLEKDEWIFGNHKTLLYFAKPL